MISKTKKWILIIIGIIILIGGVSFWFKKDDAIKDLPKETVQRNSLKRTISVTGSLVSKSPIALNFENSGRVQEIKKEVGDKVIEGETIAVLDNNVLNEQVKKAKATLEKTKMDAQKNNDSIREALEDVDNAEDYLEAVQDYHDQLVDAAEIAYENTIQYADDAEAYYNQTVDDNGVGSSEAKSAKMTLTKAENSEEESQEALTTARKNRDVYVISAENSVDSAEEDLETVESDYAELSRDASVNAAKADYQIALKALEDSSLKAPLNGVVSKMNYEPGEVLGSSSLNNSFGEMITDDFILEADVPESDIPEIKLNQTAEVTFDAFDFDEKFTAEIIEIEPASTEIQEVVYYKIKLKIKGSKNNFKEGMSADIDILIDSKKEILQVSNQFIYKEGNKNLVSIMKNGNLVKKEIEIGLDGDGGYTEIISGLKEGEEVYFEEE